MFASRCAVSVWTRHLSAATPAQAAAAAHAAQERGEHWAASDARRRYALIEARCAIRGTRSTRRLEEQGRDRPLATAMNDFAPALRDLDEAGVRYAVT